MEIETNCSACTRVVKVFFSITFSLSSSSLVASGFLFSSYAFIPFSFLNFLSSLSRAHGKEFYARELNAAISCHYVPIVHSLRSPFSSLHLTPFQFSFFHLNTGSFFLLNFDPFFLAVCLFCVDFPFSLNPIPPCPPIP